MEARLREIIKKIVKEIQAEKELEEMSVTGNVAGYNTPAAFAKPGQTKKKNKRLASISGGEVVDDLEESKDYLKNDVPADSKKPLEMKPTAAKTKPGAEIADVSGMMMAENRWVALKKEDGSAKSKIGKGITSIKQQLGEVEKFVNWYSKLKTENGITKDDYYKRTHKSLHKIKERLMNLSEKIRTL